MNYGMSTFLLAIWSAYALALGFNVITLRSDALIWRRRGMGIAIAAWALHFLWLVHHLTSFASGSRNLQGFELAMVTGWIVVGLALAFFAIWKDTALVLAPLGLGVGLIWLAMLLPAARESLPTALLTPWMPMHVGSSVVAYASFGVATAASVLYLVQWTALRFGWKLHWALRLPPLTRIERFATMCVAGGLPFIGVSMVTGTAWALQYSGSLEGWLPKVVATAFVASGYVAYLALGLGTQTLRYRPLVALATFAALVVSLLMLPLLGPGLHDFLYR